MIDIGKWAVGIDRGSGDTIIRLEFSDHAPMEFSACKEQAEAIARAILHHNANAPPTRKN